MDCKPELDGFPSFIAYFYHNLGTIGIASGLVSAVTHVLYFATKRWPIDRTRMLAKAFSGAFLPAAIGMIGASFFPEKLLGCIENVSIYILAVAISMLWIATDVLEKLFKALKPMINSDDRLSYEFLYKQTRGGILSVGGVFVLASLYSIFAHDWEGIFVGLGIVAIYSFSYLATWYRVSKGYFGSNLDEALELIAFIVNQCSKGDPPTSTRLSNDHLSQEAEAESSEIIPVPHVS